MEPGLKREIEEVLAPHIDIDVPKGHIEIAVAAAEINEAFAWTGDQVTEEMVQHTIALSERLDEMTQGGFFTVIGCDTWDPGDPMLDGEFDTLEKALQRVREIVEEERELQILSLEHTMAQCSPNSRIYWSFEEDLDKIKRGEKAATSEVLYVYHPNGDFLRKFRV